MLQLIIIDQDREGQDRLKHRQQEEVDRPLKMLEDLSESNIFRTMALRKYLASLSEMGSRKHQPMKHL
jgi:hypothetical protein